MTNLEEESARVVALAQEEADRLDREAMEKFQAYAQDMPVVFWHQPFIMRFGPDDTMLVITEVSRTGDGRTTFSGESYESYIRDHTIAGRAGG
jgi:hypothetical protein